MRNMVTISPLVTKIQFWLVTFFWGGKLLLCNSEVNLLTLKTWNAVMPPCVTFVKKIAVITIWIIDYLLLRAIFSYLFFFLPIILVTKQKFFLNEHPVHRTNEGNSTRQHIFNNSMSSQEANCQVKQVCHKSTTTITVWKQKCQINRSSVERPPCTISPAHKNDC